MSTAVAFKPTHPLVLVVPTKAADELKLKESLSIAKLLVALQFKKIQCDLVTLSECKDSRNALNF